MKIAFFSDIHANLPHYPNDNEASQQIAYRLQYYFTNNTFRKDYQAAQKESNTLSPKFVNYFQWAV